MPCYDPPWDGEKERKEYMFEQSLEASRILCEFYGHYQEHGFKNPKWLTSDLLKRFEKWTKEHSIWDSLKWEDQLKHALDWKKRQK